MPFIHSKLSIAPIQVHYYSEALPTPARSTRTVLRCKYSCFAQSISLRCRITHNIACETTSLQSLRLLPILPFQYVPNVELRKYWLGGITWSLNYGYLGVFCQFYEVRYRLMVKCCQGTICIWSVAPLNVQLQWFFTLSFVLISSQSGCFCCPVD